MWESGFEIVHERGRWRSSHGCLIFQTMKRVLVIGPGGAGKSTFARRLAERTGLPLIHLDRLYWRRGWQPTPEEEWRAKVQEIARGETWIMDGNYGGTLDLRLEACDTIVFLDVSRIVCLWRVLRRQLWHLGRVRPELAPGCPERIRWEFLTWIWTYPSRRGGRILQRLAALDGRKQVVILGTMHGIEDFMSRAGSSPPTQVVSDTSVC